MSLKPAKIFNDIKKERINLKEGIQLLLTFIENNHNTDLRLSGLKYLRLLNIKNESIFSLLESLLISDTHEKIRSFCAEFIGQKKIVENLSVFIKSARKRKEPLDHVILSGPPGLGKTCLAEIIANEMKVGFRITSGPAI